MKTGIHPDYVESHVTCSCGATFTTRSTVPELHAELCSECHPFYTGKQKLVDTGGRVERFQKRYGSTEFKSKRKQGPASEAAAETEAQEAEEADTPSEDAPVES